MSISKALQSQDFDTLKEAVESAQALYACKSPKVPTVETINGEVIVTAVFDEETKWALVGQEYTKLVNAVEGMSSDVDKKVETAKLIATNAVLVALAGRANGDDIVEDLL